MATENSSLDNIPPGKGKAKRSHEMDDQESPSWSKIKKIKKANELSSGISSAGHSSEPPASRPQSPSSSPQPAQDQIELPEPEYRSVPVNVRRRETRITPAEPPRATLRHLEPLLYFRGTGLLEDSELVKALAAMTAVEATAMTAMAESWMATILLWHDQR